MAIQLYINGTEVDLYEDEAISITSALKDFRDVTKAFGDFTQDFMIPASGHNNALLNRFADAEIVDAQLEGKDNWIDYRKKVPAYIDVDGMQNIDGFITYNKCLYKNNRMDSHVLSFTSTMLNMTEIIGDDLLSDLSWSQYDHETNGDNIKLGMTPIPSLFNGDIRYSLMTNNPVEWTVERLNDGVDALEFRPSIKVQSVFDRINAQYPKINLSYTNNIAYDDFEYDNLYLWCGNKPTDEDSGGGIILPPNSAAMWYTEPLNYQWESGNGFYVNANTGVFGYNKTWGNQFVTRIKFDWDLTPTGANAGLPYHIQIWGVNNSGELGSLLLSAGATGPYNDDIIVDRDTFTYTRFLMVLQSDSDDEIEFTYDFIFDIETSNIYNGPFGNQKGFSGSNSEITTTPIADKFVLKVPKMKIMDFITGFMTLYNCILYPNKSERDTYILEPYDSWRDLDNIKRDYEDNRIEFDEETNIESHTVTISSLPKTFNIKYKKAKAISNKLLSDFRGVGYGDLKLPSTEGTGKEYNIKLPFENMMYTNLTGGGHTYLIGNAVSNLGTFNEVDYPYDVYDGLTGVYDVPFLQIVQLQGEDCDIVITKSGDANVNVTYYTVFNSFSKLENAEGSVELISGASGNVVNITVDGVSIMNAIVPFNSTLAQTAIDVSSNINLYLTTPNYTAIANGNTIEITSDVGGGLPNGFVVESSVTTMTATDTDMSGGVLQMSLNYGQEVDAFDNQIAQVNNTLYNQAYETYMELFLNQTTRIHNYKIRLTSVDLALLDLYKTVEIGDKFFTINKYKYNSKTQVGDFELIRYLRDAGNRDPSNPTDNIDPLFCELFIEPNEPPTIPQNLNDINMAATTFTLNWDASTSSTSSVVGYNIYQNNVLIHTTSGAALFYDVTGLTPDTTYFYHVQAIDEVGVFSGLSDPLTITTFIDDELRFVDPIIFDSSTISTITIDWFDAIEGDFPIDYYDIYLEGILIHTVFEPNPNTYTFTALNDDSSYDIFIIVFDTNGDSDISETVEFSTSQVIDPIFDEPITLTNATETTLSISWLPAIEGSYPISYYELYLDSVFITIINEFEPLDYTFLGLDPDTEYEIYIIVYDTLTNNDTSISYFFDTSIDPETLIFKFRLATNNENITFASSFFNGEIDWGDGTIENYNGTQSLTHFYAGTTFRDVKISGDYSDFAADISSRDVFTDIQQWGDINADTITFIAATNLIDITATDQPVFKVNHDASNMFEGAPLTNADISGWDVSNVVNMYWMFGSSQSNQDVSGWNVSNVTDMRFMFYNNQTFNQDLSSWVVSNVLLMNNMFSLSAFNQDISGWNVSSVTNMFEMFASNTAFNQDISGWVTTSLTNLIRTFNDSVFNQDLSGWDVSNVTDALDMFINAPLSDANYVLLLGGWAGQTLQSGVNFGTDAQYTQVSEPDRDTLTDAPNLWIITDGGCSDCVFTIGDFVFEVTVGNSDPMLFESATFTGTVFYGDGTDIEYFGSTQQLTHEYASAGTYEVIIRGDYSHYQLSPGSVDKLVDVLQWGDINADVIKCGGSSLTTLSATDQPVFKVGWDATSMFINSTTFNGDIGGWDVSNIVNMAGMLTQCQAFNQDLSSWIVTGVTSMNNMFRNTLSNFSLDGWNVSNVTNMEAIFAFASYNQPLNSWDVSNVTTLTNAFSYSDFNQPLDNWVLTDLASLFGTFEGNTTFNQDISGWTMPSLTNTHQTFFGASAFNQDVSGWFMENVAIRTRMFKDATVFNQDLSSWDMVAMTDGEDMLVGSAWSDANYNLALAAWASQTPLSVSLFGTDAQYNLANQANRDIVDNDWLITDGGCSDCPVSAIEFLNDDYDATVTDTFSYDNDGDFIICITNNPADIITNVAYNGVSMTLIDDFFYSTFNRFYRVYGLVNPTQGTNDFVVTGGDSSGLVMASMGNVDQSTPFNAVQTAITIPSTTTPSRSTTTTIDNAFVIGVHVAGQYASVGAGTSAIVLGTAWSVYLHRTTNEITPVGVGTININLGLAKPVAMMVFALNNG